MFSLRHNFRRKFWHVKVLVVLITVNKERRISKSPNKDLRNCVINQMRNMMKKFIRTCAKQKLLKTKINVVAKLRNKNE
jgi:hypothetical protein